MLADANRALLQSLACEQLPGLYVMARHLVGVNEVVKR